MLSMKTLRVAIVTMGSALLLGPGLAAAIDLDGTGTSAPVPVSIATQTIPPATAIGQGQGMYHAINVGDVDLEITPEVVLRAADGYFVRVALGGGMVFHGTLAAPTGTTLEYGGDDGDNEVVFRLTADHALTAKVSLGVDENLAIPTNGEASYTASMTMHRDLFDARDGYGALGRIGAENVAVVRAVSGIDATITPKDATADVETGFLWFIGPDDTNVSGVELGTAKAAAITGQGVLDARDGLAVTDADLIVAEGVTIGIEGDFSVGVFDLVPTTVDADGDPKTTDDISENPCTDRKGTASTPVMAGNLVPDEDDPTMATLAGQEAGEYKLCIEVDSAGPNTMQIPAGDYTATVYTKASATEADVMANEGRIGTIKRNGTTVNIAYLTASEKYNQRLIIVNRGLRAAEFDLHSFTTEVGSDTTVTLSATAQAAKDAGLNVIPPNGQVVARVADILEFTGERKRRVGATLSLNADVDDIQVATTQVNLEDGSTDTVIYASEGGAEVN